MDNGDTMINQANYFALDIELTLSHVLKAVLGFTITALILN